MSISHLPRTVDLASTIKVAPMPRRPCRRQGTVADPPPDGDGEPGVEGAFAAEPEQPNVLREDLAPAALAMLIVIGVLGAAAVVVSMATAALIGFLTG
ncbi:MAG TPA: hypothetical protein VK095_11760 [Beutenbergiaceae bacterium]|nr:hypothetical protein [Beutenbergiaceae bacterium]